jgi:hypothetical protein
MRITDKIEFWLDEATGLFGGKLKKSPPPEIKKILQKANAGKEPSKAEKKALNKYYATQDKKSKSEREDWAQEKKRAWAEDIKKLKEVMISEAKPLKFDNMEEFKSWVKKRGATADARPKTGVWKGGKQIGAYFEKGGKIEVDLREAEEDFEDSKNLTKYLKSMKGKSEKDIVKGLKKKFGLSQDDAERALELVEAAGANLDTTIQALKKAYGKGDRKLIKHLEGIARGYGMTPHEIERLRGKKEAPWPEAYKGGRMGV